VTEPSDTGVIRGNDRQFFWHPSAQMAEYGKTAQTIIARGEGYRVWDIDGNEYIDGNSSVWCVNLGYSQSRLVDAAARQLAVLPHASLSAFSHAPAANLAARLAKLAPEEGYRVQFATSGAEAVEASIKMSRQLFRQNGQASRRKVIALRGSYHGMTIGALSATGLAAERRSHEPLQEGFAHVEGPNCFRCPWGKTYPSCNLECAQALSKEIEFHGADHVAAILIEPIVASGGMYVPPARYMQEVADIARKSGALLIFDEVTTGFGRTGKMFSFQHWGLAPDIYVLSKGITSGYQPLSAVVASKKVFEGFLGTKETGRAFNDFHTFGGHPAACAVALEVLDIYAETNVIENVVEIGRYLRSALDALRTRHRCIGDVRGLGLMYGIEFTDPNTSDSLPSNRVREVPVRAMKHGLIVRVLRQVGHTLCLLPPLILDKGGVDALVDRLDRAIGEVFPEWTT
jgi:adenosylmethionine-8-amino-7-oxononanoate aminotransferase